MEGLFENSSLMLAYGLCVLLVCMILVLAGKVLSLRRGADELREEFAARLREDTNVGIDISTSDAKMRALAADMDRQLKLLREEHIRYMQGDVELKAAVTNISHDLRTPLTAICGYMELLSREELPETAREYLAVIENRIFALKELTEELFRYSVILSADSDMERETLSLNAALEDCVAAYYGAFRAAGIEPQIIIPEEPVARTLNSQALSRILTNVVSNVLKYSDGDFSITLQEDGTIHFCNQAKGLDVVQVGHLFERFYTVQSGKNATGLGLSIARNLTEEMGGEIAAEYEDEMLHILIRFPEEGGAG